MITRADYDHLAGFFPALSDLPEVLQNAVLDSAIAIRMKAGAVAFEEYASCDSFPMLTEGRIRVTKPAPNGREILLYRVDPGQTCVLTLNCLLSDVEYSARGVAARDCAGIALPQSTFLRLVDEGPRFRDFVFRSLSRRILDLMELIEEVAFNRLDQRLAKLLSSAAGSEQDGPVEKTHQQLADELGSVREIVSRILGSFADSGFVQLERGRIRVIDRAGLQKVSERP